MAAHRGASFNYFFESLGKGKEICGGPVSGGKIFLASAGCTMSKGLHMFAIASCFVSLFTKVLVLLKDPLGGALGVFTGRLDPLYYILPI